MNYARVKSRVLQVMGDEGQEVVKYIESIVPKGHVVVPFELVEAVAHVGIDFGYGKYEIEEEHINTARNIYEARVAIKND